MHSVRVLAIHVTVNHIKIMYVTQQCARSAPCKVPDVALKQQNSFAMALFRRTGMLINP